ncbi:basic amino acid transmembrane transporter [Malassezia pachydermatis]
MGHTADENRQLRGRRGSGGNHYGAVGVSSQQFGEEPKNFRHILLPCLAMWSITFMGSLDATIVAMLIGNISSSFKAADKASWIGTTFLLSVCCTVPLYGRLSDLFGRKRSLMLAVIIFTLGTMWCAMASSMFEFLCARTLAGIGSGGLSIITSVIMSTLVPLKSRGLFQGMSNVVFGVGVGLGAPVGGLLNDSIGWRGAFFVQLPVLGLCLASLLFLLPHDESIHFAPGDSTWKRIMEVDILGLSIFAVIPLSILYALNLISSQDRSLADPFVSGSLLCAAIAIFLLYVVERRARMPLISLEVLSLRSCWSSVMANFFLSVMYFSFNYNVPLYFQTVGNMRASSIGMRMIPASLSVGMGSLLSGFYMKHFGRYYKYCIFCATGVCVMFSPALTYFLDPPTISPFICYTFMQFCIAGYLTSSLIALIHCVNKKNLAVATGMNYLFRTTGQVLGVAVSGVILQKNLLANLRQRIVGPGAEELIQQIRQDTTVLSKLPEGVRQDAIYSYASAFHSVYIFIFATCVMALLYTLFIEDKHLDEEHGLVEDLPPPQQVNGRTEQ